MSEWFKVHPWKGCVGASPPGVRIPIFPICPDALHSAARKPRQIRKEAAVFGLQWCRRLSGLFFTLFTLGLE